MCGMLICACNYNETVCFACVSDIMAADKQLAEEIEFDLKRFEEEQKKIAKPQTPLSATPHAQMVLF